MKQRRDITLGEMQDECERVECNCECCEKNIHNACCSMQNSIHDSATPRRWNLTDPPRFNADAMEFWAALFNVGVKYVYRGVYGLFLSDCDDGDGNMGVIKKSEVIYWLKAADRLDLAELLGKDGAE